MKHDVRTTVRLLLYFLFSIVVAMSLVTFVPAPVPRLELSRMQLAITIAIALAVIILTTILWTFAFKRWKVPIESIYGVLTAVVISNELFRLTATTNIWMKFAFYFAMAHFAIYTFACMKHSWKMTKQMYPYANILMMLTIVIVMVQLSLLLPFWSTLGILGAFAVYDYIAVKRGLMVDLAKGFLKARIVPGIVVPKSEGRRLAIIGGGDVAFLVLVACAAYQLGTLAMMTMAVTMFLGLIGLFLVSRKGKFYPALPPIFAGAMLGLLIVKVFL